MKESQSAEILNLPPSDTLEGMIRNEEYGTFHDTKYDEKNAAWRKHAQGRI